MTFTYETTGDKTWVPETHTYNFTDGDGWKATGNDVTVTNHSNAPVNVAFSSTKDTTTYKGEYTGSMSVTERQLAAGVENKPDEADSVTSTLTLTGGLNRTVSNGRAVRPLQSDPAGRAFPPRGTVLCDICPKGRFSLLGRI
mgnify:CR=1 FL=1